MSYLTKNKNRIITKAELFQNVWGDSFVGDGTLNVHIRHLREKVESNAKDPQFIKTVWGTGYVLEDVT
ncbi:winged helix-turn-helix domain-containing protein [Metabacillus lacus]|uniref:winged helix-turn-helix domain-containing protein n=1 Tax=Metabacillus lacus TaxID=1983721 RepID=UPI001FEBBB76|nr:helix-turn-helix domain-containing protein [Metabacillus lacus]